MFVKDKIYRIGYLNSEVKNLKYKFLISNQFLSSGVKFFIFKKTVKNKFFKTLPHNRCLLTGRSRSCLKFFHVSRIKFREMALSGSFVGVKKSSW